MGVGHRSYNRALALHYNGSNWTEVFVPQVGTFRSQFNSVHGIRANDVWAVGTWSNNYGDFHLLAMHWNGNTWVNTPLASVVSSDFGELLDVRMVSSDDVWAVGSLLTGGIVMLHWNGTSWNQVSTPGGGGAFAVLNSNDIYAVGSNIVHWDGNAWTIVDSLSEQSYPALSKTVVLPNNEIWAAGRTVDLNNVFKTLVYRRLPTSQDTAKINIVAVNNAGDCSSTNSLSFRCTESTLPYTVRLFRFGIAYGQSLVVRDNNVFKISNLPKGYYTATVQGAGASQVESGKSKPVVLSPVPTNLAETNITGTQAKLNWTSKPCVTYYQVQYRVVGTKTWTTKRTNGNTSFFTAKNLTSGKKYEWRVAPADSANKLWGIGTYTKADTFTTIQNSFTMTSKSSEDFISSTNINHITIYPNPATTQFTLKLRDIVVGSPLFVTLRDRNGKVVWSKRNIIATHSATIIDVSKLPSGIYLLQMSNNSNPPIIAKKVAVSR